MIQVRSIGTVQHVDPVRVNGNGARLLTWKHIDGRGQGAVQVLAVLHGATEAQAEQIKVGALACVRGRSKPIIEAGQPVLMLNVEDVLWIKKPDDGDTIAGHSGIGDNPTGL